LRSVKGDQGAEPEEVSIKYMRELLKENNVSYEELDNENIKDLLLYLDNNETSHPPSHETENSPLTFPSPRHTSKYSLYVYI